MDLFPRFVPDATRRVFPEGRNERGGWSRTGHVGYVKGGYPPWADTRAATISQVSRNHDDDHRSPRLRLFLDWLGLEELLMRPRFQAHSVDTVATILNLVRAPLPTFCRGRRCASSMATQVRSAYRERGGDMRALNDACRVVAAVVTAG